MAISYNAIKNHTAKVTMPAVENGWYLSSNITRDPPKSITTRRKDLVGDTSMINEMIEDSPDRQCEAINYYARGVNPMVSVDYGQGQTGSGVSCSGGGSQAYLPYRIIREGAFRPPVMDGIKNLLPLSRLPRILTTVCATPYQPIFTKRMRNCGTSEQTREVHNNILKTSCMTQKLIQAFPNLNEPITTLKIREDLPLVNIKSKNSCPTSVVEIQQRLNQQPIRLLPTRPNTNITSNVGGQNENFHTYDHVYLNPTRPNTTIISNVGGQNENVNTYDHVYLNPTRPNTTINSNVGGQNENVNTYDYVYLNPTRPGMVVNTNQTAMTYGNGDVNDKEYKRLHERVTVGGFEGSRNIPKTIDNPVKILKPRS